MMQPDIDLTAKQSLHAPAIWLLLGVCGSGMRAFAGMLQDAGHEVIGTDVDTEGLMSLQSSPNPVCRIIPWTVASDLSSVSPDRIVHSVAVSPINPLIAKARDAGVPVLALPQALGTFLKDTRQLCVAGTHGKTTTGGMIWWILQQAGLAPAGFIGGEFREIHRSGTFGAGRIAVVESCEYRQSFLQLRPQSVVLTGIEPDHFDCFPADGAADHLFQMFVEQLPPDGVLIVNAGSPRAADTVRGAPCRVQTFGTSETADWRAHPIRAQLSAVDHHGGGIPGQAFEVLHLGKSVAEVVLRVPGFHNRENAVAAFAAAAAEGLPPDEISRHLATFPGMCRRFEYRGNWRGVDLIDDYAHHPSAIQAAERTARAVFPGRRIIAVFEPHQISRLENLFNEFAFALSAFDECLILPVLPARETATMAQCCRLSGTLVRRISGAGVRSFLMANLDQVRGRLDHAARPGDVVITMGAGRTYQIHDEIHRRLHRDSAA